MISETPETYVPALSEQGEYIDHIPFLPPIGIRCPCTQRVYERRQQFRTHTGSEIHISWLRHMNQNRENYYKEAMERKEIVRQQQQLLTAKEVEIAKLTTHIAALSMTIFELKEEVRTLRGNQTVSLIDLDEGEG